MAKQTKGGAGLRPYLYFAYGSNLDVEQMAGRCPGARMRHPYTLKDWRLVFRGVADVIPAEGHEVRGGLYTITAEDEAGLDRYEGYPSLYTKVWYEDPSLGLIMFYVMNGRSKRFDRQDWAMPASLYLGTIRQGFRDWEIPAKFLQAGLQFTQAQIHQETALTAQTQGGE